MPELSEFVGIPYLDHGRSFSGCDCWGLVRLFYLEMMHVELPAYVDMTYSSSTNSLSASLAIAVGKQSWSQVGFDDRKFGDAVIFRIKGYPCHIGVALGKKSFLHTLNGRQSSIEDFDSILWSKNVHGVFRWVS